MAATAILKRSTLARSHRIIQQRTLFGSASATTASASQDGSTGHLSKRGSVNVYKEHKVLPYTPEQMYRIVADIDAYSYFIPYLSHSEVLSPANNDGTKPWLGNGDKGELHELKAKLTIGFAAFEQSYVSQVKCRKWDLVTATSHAPDLFKTLSTTWKLLPESPTSTTVSMELAYEFASPLYAMASGAVFEQVSKKVMKGFEKRCRVMYAPRVEA